MVQVVVGNNVDRRAVIVTEDTTLREILEENGIDYTRGGIHLDGTTIPAGGLDKTLGEYGVTEKAYLLQVVKADNA